MSEEAFMARATVRRRSRYWFDNTMSRGTPALIGWLAVVSMALVVTLSVLMALFDTKRTTTGHTMTDVWDNVVSTFRLGEADHGGLIYRCLVIALALAGIFFASTLISLLTSGVNKKLVELRKGRSAVLESGHTAIIGWSDQIFTVITELVEANANHRRSRIAILADKDRTAMEEAIRKNVPTTATTRVICRTGDPMDPDDIDIVSPQTARSIIVLPPDGDSNPDPHVTKVLLAIVNSSTRGEGPYHVVTSVRDEHNHEVMALAGGPETILIDDDVAARVLVQTCRQSGLSWIYTELMRFEGDEIYIQPQPELAGRSFGEALSAYRTSSVMGLLRGGDTVLLNPPMDTVIGPGDQVIVVSNDDDTVVLDGSENPVVDESAIAEPPVVVAVPERTLMLGWNRRSEIIIRQLDDYVIDGSILQVVDPDPEIKRTLEIMYGGLSHLELVFTLGDPTERAMLDDLDVGDYDHVLVLSGEGNPQQADARALVTLLHLRRLQANSGQRYSITSEMADDRNRRLAQVTKADDFIVSQQVISLMMTMLSENRRLAEVFADLFDAAGSEIYLKPAEYYVTPGVEVDFHTVVEAARRRGECPLGYRQAAHSQQPPAFGITWNPDKQDRFTLAPGDRIIVLAEDDLS
jgi:ion channel POLLUX/CASTOR